MKNKHIPSILTTAVLCALLSFGGIRCLSTAFAIDLSPALLMLNCCIWALAGCILLAQPKGGRWLLCGLVLLAVYLWRRTQLVDQILQLCYKISRLYSAAYGFQWIGRPADTESVALPLYLWAGINALITGWTMTRRRFTPAAVFFSLVPLALCLVLTNTIPTLDGIFWLLLGLILLLLTQGVRRRNPAQADRLIRLLSIPVAAALGLLFLATPQATYNKQHYADRMGDALLRLVDRIPYVDILSDGSVHFSLIRHIPDYVDLQYKGVNRQFPIPVMEVTAEASGTLYLRGRGYDTYTGSEWYASSASVEPFTSTQNHIYIQPQPLGELTIKTSGSLSSRYLPYYPDVSYLLQDGACNNLGNTRAYSYNWYTLPERYYTPTHNWKDPDGGLYSRITYESYLQLPEATQTWAKNYLAAHLTLASDEDTIGNIANAIAGLVRSSAEYDLDTARMPAGTPDFARWFLEESDTGYCVHYATATTVLLRAAGIPARYVEGYLAEAAAGQTVTVTEKDAHAWAEYYIVGIGWLPLESTAGELNSGISAPVPSTATTQPDDTTAPAPSVTEESTAPPDTSESTTAPSRPVPLPTDTTTGAPIQGTTDPTVSEPAEKEPFTVSKPVLLALGLMLLLLAQYPIRLRLRETYLHTGDTNRRALKNWRFVCRLARLAGQAPPKEIHELALRAKFSPYILTEEDLARFDTFRSQTVSQLRRRPWWQQIYHRLLWAAY